MFDFTSILERRGMDAIAVDALGKGSFAPDRPDEGFSAIPMWVADMNFAVPPCITDAISRRAAHPAFGYFSPREEYYQAIIDWQHIRNGVEGIGKDFIGYHNGVLGGVLSALNALCGRGGKVLLHSPTYIGFTGALENSGFRIVLSDLKKDGQGIWRMDLKDMEEKILANRIRACVFCSPHNPCGRVWEREELEEMMALFRKHDVYVVSDEIWSDLTLEGYRHVPTQSISEDAKNRTVALYAPSKTFNLAGLVGSYDLIWSRPLRERVRLEADLSHYNSMNVLSMAALIGAYSQEGMAWLEELRSVITANVDYACVFIRDHFPGVEVVRPQGTYMLFLDCSAWCREHGMDLDGLLRAGWKVGVAWQDGRPFHGPCHIRVNLALPLSLVKEAFDRLEKHVFC